MKEESKCLIANASKELVPSDRRRLKTTLTWHTLPATCCSRFVHLEAISGSARAEAPAAHHGAFRVSRAAYRQVIVTQLARTLN